MTAPIRIPPKPVDPVLWGEERRRRLEEIVRKIKEAEAA